MAYGIRLWWYWANRSRPLFSALKLAEPPLASAKASRPPKTQNQVWSRCWSCDPGIGRADVEQTMALHGLPSLEPISALKTEIYLAYARWPFGYFFEATFSCLDGPHGGQSIPASRVSRRQISSAHLPRLLNPLGGNSHRTSPEFLVDVV